jgi:hypothetical protein
VLAGDAAGSLRRWPQTPRAGSGEELDRFDQGVLAIAFAPDGAVVVNTGSALTRYELSESVPGSETASVE